MYQVLFQKPLFLGLWFFLESILNQQCKKNFKLTLSISWWPLVMQKWEHLEPTLRDWGIKCLMSKTRQEFQYVTELVHPSQELTELNNSTSSWCLWIKGSMLCQGLQKRSGDQAIWNMHNMGMQRIQLANHQLLGNNTVDIRTEKNTDYQ